MLVTCRQCGTGFDHKMGRCAACGTALEATTEDRVALRAEEAAGRLRAGERREAVRTSLATDYGLTELEADEAMKRASATLAKESRSHARHIVTSGVVLLLIAAGVYLFTGGLLIASGCLTLGLAMVLVGEVKLITGWNITGRDDG